jgi:vacuolar-type H+-ATPase subunit D/Vma8
MSIFSSWLTGPREELMAKMIAATNTTRQINQGKEKGMGNCVKRILCRDIVQPTEMVQQCASFTSGGFFFFCYLLFL